MGWEADAERTMKIQLLQDIDDSGARPRPPRPAVWHRAQAGGDDLRSRPWTAEPARPQVDAGNGSGTFQPPHAREAPAARREPDWLIELMREDAERAGAQSRAGRWKRRIVTWTVAGSAIAVLAAGGLWLYEERRVDGALVVAAQTTPPAPSAAAPPVARAAPEASVAPAAPQAPVAAAPVAPVSTPDYAATQNIVVPVRPSSVAAGEAHPAAPAVRRQRAAANSRPASTRPAERAAAARLRREETLLQCRALGYDEAQCIRKACTMTRFGLACRA
jgi:hypothetical protein